MQATGFNHRFYVSATWLLITNISVVGGFGTYVACNVNSFYLLNLFSLDDNKHWWKIIRYLVLPIILNDHSKLYQLEQIGRPLEKFECFFLHHQAPLSVWKNCARQGSKYYHWLTTDVLNLINMKRLHIKTNYTEVLLCIFICGTSRNLPPVTPQISKCNVSNTFYVSCTDGSSGWTDILRSLLGHCFFIS